MDKFSHKEWGRRQGGQEEGAAQQRPHSQGNLPTNRAAAVAPSAASSTPPWPRELAERKRAGRSTTGETTAWRREQRSSDGDGLAEPSILQAPVDGLAAPPRARRCVPPHRGGAASARQAIGGEGGIGIGEEERHAIGAAARVSLRAASFICHSEQKTDGQDSLQERSDD
jgi:hypothetical protein